MSGYAFTGTDGSCARATDYELGLHSRIMEMIPSFGHLLPKIEGIADKIQFGRSFRRGSNTQALKNVPINVMHAVTRWSNKEKEGQGVDVRRPMHEH
jgi:hypothetical protein